MLSLTTAPRAAQSTQGQNRNQLEAKTPPRCACADRSAVARAWALAKAAAQQHGAHRQKKPACSAPDAAQASWAGLPGKRILPLNIVQRRNHVPAAPARLLHGNLEAPEALRKGPRAGPEARHGGAVHDKRGHSQIIKRDRRHLYPLAVPILVRPAKHPAIRIRATVSKESWRASPHAQKGARQT
jgi:hypothetical protein